MADIGKQVAPEEWQAFEDHAYGPAGLFYARNLIAALEKALEEREGMLHQAYSDYVEDGGVLTESEWGLVMRGESSGLSPVEFLVRRETRDATRKEGAHDE